jgi:rod shape-determining protein MreB
MSRDLAIDLGSANTLVLVRGKGIVLTQPTVIAMNERTGEVLAMGEDALRAAGTDSEPVVTYEPLRRGAVSDFALTERFLHLLLRRIGAGRVVKPRALVSIPSSVTVVERRAVEEAMLQAGARHVFLIEKPIAAAIGAGLPIDEPTGNCVVDVGGGTTEVAVISMGGIVSSRMMPIGGFDFDQAIQRYLRDEHGMVVGGRTVEALKMTVGSAAPLEEELKADVSGREIETGAPKSVIVSSEEIRGALGETTRVVVEAVRGALADTPPELAHDVLDRGIYLCGGGALLKGFDRRLATETGIPILPAESQLETVCRGAGQALDELDRMRARGLVYAPDATFR